MLSVNVNVVSLIAMVHNRDDRVIRDLRADAFVLKEDGHQPGYGLQFISRGASFLFPTQGVFECTVSVVFKPATVGALTASLSIADNAAGTPQAVTLTGTSASAVTLTPTSLTFASTAVGSTTAAQLVTVKNSGTAALTLTSETITGTAATSFLKSATTCGTSLAVGATCTVSVEFKPAAAGALTASLSIADNATGSPQTVTLTGTAWPPQPRRSH